MAKQGVANDPVGSSDENKRTDRLLARQEANTMSIRDIPGTIATYATLNNWTKALVVAPAAILLIATNAFGMISLYGGIAYSVVMIFAYLSLVDEQIHSLTTKVGKLSSDSDIGTVYETERELEEEIDAILGDDIDEPAIFVEYSAEEAKYLLRKVLNQNKEIYLLLKLPRESIDAGQGDSQRRRIFGVVTQILEDRSDELENINIIFYTCQASIRGRLIGDDHLFLGWYNYEVDDSPTIWGHSNPILYVNGDHEHFEKLQNFFFAIGVQRLWGTAVFPADLVDEDSSIKQPNWVSTFLEEGDAEERVERFREVTPANRSFEEEFSIVIDETPGPKGYQTFHPGDE